MYDTNTNSNSTQTLRCYQSLLNITSYNINMITAKVVTLTITLEV